MRVPWIPEATGLLDAGPDYLGREAWLTPATATAWDLMWRHALMDGIELLLISAFRSISRQEELVLAKLARGMSLEETLLFSAYPGYSEHHSGEAIDIGTMFSPLLEEEFEDTAAFSWLCTNAAAHGFHLSYPRDNPTGIAYEPWHWRYHGF